MHLGDQAAELRVLRFLAILPGMVWTKTMNKMMTLTQHRISPSETASSACGLSAMATTPELIEKRVTRIHCYLSIDPS